MDEADASGSGTGAPRCSVCLHSSTEDDAALVSTGAGAVQSTAGRAEKKAIMPCTV